MRPLTLFFYFGAGFFVGCIFAMSISLLLRTALLQAGSVGRFIGALAPLLLGLFGGIRTAYFGYKTQAPLNRALKRAFLFRPV